MTIFQLTPTGIVIAITATVVSSLFIRAFYNIYLHPLSKYPGPWYASAFSLSGAIVSLLRVEPQWLLGLVNKYGTDQPIRISPTLLFWPKPSVQKEIYWDPACNQKSGFYGSGLLGPPHLFSTLDGNEHMRLRKALSNATWSIGGLKKSWENKFDDQVSLFIHKMSEKAEAKKIVCLSDKVAEFAADIMTMISFTEPWGFVRNGRDERQILENWRQGLDFFGFAARFRFFREVVLKVPVINVWLIPVPSNNHGMGWLMLQGNKMLADREMELSNGIYPEEPDFMQHAIDARLDDEPLTLMQKRAHITLLVQAGADTTGTALGCTLRFLASNPNILNTARKEIEAAESAGKLSTPIKYEEVRMHLPYFVACIEESLRLEPPAPNLFSRVVGKAGKKIQGHFIPPGTEITTHAYTVQRDPTLYAPDPTNYRPERWLESPEKASEYDASQFVFGMGPRVCLGKDIALMELYKLLPEIVRKFNIEVLNKGRYVVAGGVAYNKNFEVMLSSRI